jgi:putative ABC transport system permease protein
VFRHLPFVIKNCWRNRRRTTLTILSIGVSLCLLGTLLAIYHAFYMSEPSPAQALRLVTRNKISLTQPLPEFYAQKIKQIAGVREIDIENWFGGIYIDNRPEHMFARFAVEPDKVFAVHGELEIPEDQKKAFEQERSACVIGRKIATKYNLHLGDRVTLLGDIYPVTLELTVRGIFDSEGGTEVLYFNRKYLEESLPERRRGFAGIFTILANSTDDVPRITEAVDESFQNSTAQTKTETESAFALGFVNGMGNVKMFLLSICAAVTFTILLVSANTIAMSVRERVREVGILKTLGYTRGIILGIIVGEAIMISLVGGAIGIALAAFLVRGVRGVASFFPQIAGLHIVPSVAAMCLGLAGMIGLVSAFIPAFNASRISIVEALRGAD